MDDEEENWKIVDGRKGRRIKERERVNDFHLNYSKNSVEQNSPGAPAPISSDAQETHFIA